MRVETDDEDVPMVSKEWKTKIIEEVAIEQARELRIENSGETERVLKEKHTVDRNLEGSEASELEVGPELEVVKSTMKMYCFIRDTSFSELEDEYELVTGSSRAEKVTLVRADPLVVSKVSRALRTSCSRKGIWKIR